MGSYASATNGMHSSFRSRLSVRSGSLPRKAGKARSRELDGTARQPYDNAKAESFMKKLKVEEVYLMAYESFEAS